MSRENVLGNSVNSYKLSFSKTFAELGGVISGSIGHLKMASALGTGGGKLQAFWQKKIHFLMQKCEN